jgi:hypothetical protein
MTSNVEEAKLEGKCGAFVGKRNSLQCKLPEGFSVVGTRSWPSSTSWISARSTTFRIVYSHEALHATMYIYCKRGVDNRRQRDFQKQGIAGIVIASRIGNTWAMIGWERPVGNVISDPVHGVVRAMHITLRRVPWAILPGSRMTEMIPVVRLREPKKPTTFKQVGLPVEKTGNRVSSEKLT